MAAEQQGSCTKAQASIAPIQAEIKSMNEGSFSFETERQSIPKEIQPAECNADAEEKSSSFMSSDSTATTKRQDYISWDDYFVAVSFLSAMRSKGAACCFRHTR